MICARNGYHQSGMIKIARIPNITTLSCIFYSGIPTINAIICLHIENCYIYIRLKFIGWYIRGCRFPKRRRRRRKNQHRLRLQMISCRGKMNSHRMFIISICSIVLLVRSRCFYSISNIISLIYRKPFGKHTWFLFMARFFPLYSTEIDYVHTKHEMWSLHMIWSAIDGWKPPHRILPIHQFTDEFLICCLSTSSIAW